MTVRPVEHVEMELDRTRDDRDINPSLPGMYKVTASVLHASSLGHSLCRRRSLNLSPWWSVVVASTVASVVASVVASTRPITSSVTLSGACMESHSSCHNWDKE